MLSLANGIFRLDNNGNFHNSALRYRHSWPFLIWLWRQRRDAREKHIDRIALDVFNHVRFLKSPNMPRSVRSQHMDNSPDNFCVITHRLFSNY